MCSSYIILLLCYPCTVCCMLNKITAVQNGNKPVSALKMNLLSAYILRHMVYFASIIHNLEQGSPPFQAMACLKPGRGRDGQASAYEPPLAQMAGKCSCAWRSTFAQGSCACEQSSERTSGGRLHSYANGALPANTTALSLREWSFARGFKHPPLKHEALLARMEGAHVCHSHK